MLVVQNESTRVAASWSPLWKDTSMQVLYLAGTAESKEGYLDKSSQSQLRTPSPLPFHRLCLTHRTEPYCPSTVLIPPRGVVFELPRIE
jgi:hypothetical protein